MTKHIPWLTVLFLFCLLVIVKRTEASERHDHQTAVTNVTVHKSDDNTGKAVALSALFVCGVVPAWDSHIWPTIKAVFTLTWPKYKAYDSFCFPDEKPEPLPDPGPAVQQDVTPSNLKDRKRTYIIEAH